VVTWKGRIIGERYGEGITARTPLESWVYGEEPDGRTPGILIKQGVYDLDQACSDSGVARPNDPRAKIRIADLMHMSSGLRIRAPQDPDFDPSGPYPDHLYLHGGVNLFHYAATRPLQWPPGTVGRYHNTDPVLVNYLIRLAVEKRGESTSRFRDGRCWTDRHPLHGDGNRSVWEFSNAGIRAGVRPRLGASRDLYLQDGVWQGERILPEGFVQFVSTVAPAWAADHRPVYGGFFWINGDTLFPVPKSGYYMTGVGGSIR